MTRMQCPRCSTQIDVPAGATPVCPSCGFGDGGAKPVEYASAPVAAASSVVTPEGRGPTGKVREPVVVALLWLFTFGVYPLVWYWKQGKEMDGFRGESSVFTMMKPAVITAAVASITVLLVMIIGFTLFLTAFPLEAMFDENYEFTEEDQANLRSLIGPAIALAVILGLAFIASLVGSVLTYMGLWRLWNRLNWEQNHLQLPKAAQPGLLLLMVLSPLIISFVTIPVAFIPIVGGILSNLASLVASGIVIWAMVWTQVMLNDLWRRYGAA